MTRKRKLSGVELRARSFWVILAISITPIAVGCVPVEGEAEVLTEERQTGEAGAEEEPETSTTAEAEPEASTTIEPETSTTIEPEPEPETSTTIEPEPEPEPEAETSTTIEEEPETADFSSCDWGFGEVEIVPGAECGTILAITFIEMSEADALQPDATQDSLAVKSEAMVICSAARLGEPTTYLPDVSAYVPGLARKLVPDYCPGDPSVFVPEG